MLRSLILFLSNMLHNRKFFIMLFFLNRNYNRQWAEAIVGGYSRIFFIMLFFFISIITVSELKQLLEVTRCVLHWELLAKSASSAASNIERCLFPKTLFKGTVQTKNNKIFEKKFFASNEVSTCSGCCCEILQVCDVCKGGLRGLNGTTTHQYLGNMEQKNRSPEKFQIYIF